MAQWPPLGTLVIVSTLSISPEKLLNAFTWSVILENGKIIFTINYKLLRHFHSQNNEIFACCEVGCCPRLSKQSLSSVKNPNFKNNYDDIMISPTPL